MQSLDLQHIKHIFEKSTEAAEASSSTQITPLQPGDVKCIDNVSDGEEMRWIRAGFKLIAQVLGIIRAYRTTENCAVDHDFIEGQIQCHSKAWSKLFPDSRHNLVRHVAACL